VNGFDKFGVANGKVESDGKLMRLDGAPQYPFDERTGLMHVGG